MRRRPAVLIALLLLVVWALAPTSASGLSAKLDYHVSDAFIAAGIEIPQTGARARADNGDIISVVGAGTFNLGSEKADGGGTFVHTNSAGVLQGSGTWTATGVDDFTFYGCGGDLPSNFCGGALTLNVHLVGAGGAPELDGLLRIDCLIGDFPPDAVEGITLDLPGVINFDETIFDEETFDGLTLYVSRSKN